MAVGPIGVSSSSASSSISSASQSIAFNPVITLASPESNIRNQPTTDQRNTADARSTTEAKAETSLPGIFGGAGDAASGFSGFAPLLSLASNRGTTGGAPATLAGDLVGARPAGPFTGMNGLLLLGGLAVAAFFLVRKFG